MRVLGVDPGSVSAAWGLYDGVRVALADDVPVVDRMVDAAAWRRIVTDLAPDLAIIELVSSMPKQGIASAFRFGMGCGILRGVIAGAGVPIINVTPGKWKKHFRLDNDGEKSRALAIRRFPNVTTLARKKDHGRAEALLLALWKFETDDPV